MRHQTQSSRSPFSEQDLLDKKAGNGVIFVSSKMSHIGVTLYLVEIPALLFQVLSVDTSALRVTHP